MISILRKIVSLSEMGLLEDFVVGVVNEKKLLAQILLSLILLQQLQLFHDNHDYFLNNTRCRRKDIREVFLGTGLGPRSYAIIEQGMISRLVEAKPEELRTYLEEAAGISKYKEKRRETELRLKHTKDNLNRLNDVMKEINSQLGKLERQAKAANDYKVLKDTERKLKLDLLCINLSDYNTEIESLDKMISKNNIEHEKQKSVLTNRDKKIEETRLKRGTEQDIFNATQADFYDIGSEIAKCEKDIEHSQESESSRQQNINEIIISIDNIDLICKKLFIFLLEN